MRLFSVRAEPGTILRYRPKSQVLTTLTFVVPAAVRPMVWEAVKTGHLVPKFSPPPLSLASNPTNRLKKSAVGALGSPRVLDRGACLAVPTPEDDKPYVKEAGSRNVT